MNERDTDYFKENKMLINPDEFLLDNIKSYHYEVMDEGHHVWMAFYMEGKTGHLNIFLNDGKIQTRYEEWNDTTESKWDDPIPPGVDPWNLRGRS